MDGQERGIGTELTDLLSDDLKLVLKWGVTLLLFKLIHDLTEGREFTDDDDNHITGAVLDAGTRQDDGRGKLVGILSGLPRLEVLQGVLTEAHAYRQGLLTTLIRLSSHGSLVSHHLVARDADTIDGDDVTSLQVHDITDLKLVRVQLLGRNIVILIEACHIDLI